MRRFLEEDVLHYLDAQERFESLRLETIQKVGRQFCDLAYANPYDGPIPQAVNAMRTALEAQNRLNLQYTPYGGNTITRRLVAQHLGKSHRLNFHWRQIVLTPGSMAALNLVFRSMSRKSYRSKVVVITPCWFDYPLYLANLGLEPVFVPLCRDTMRLDLEAIREALDDQVQGIILSQPANPTGLIYHAGELRQLARILDESPTRPVLVSDECHRGILLEPEAFCSPAEFYDNTCIVYSFGKSLQIQGQRIGYVAVSPRMERADHYAHIMERLCRIMGFCTPTALMQIAIRELLDETPDLERIRQRRDLILGELRKAGYEVQTNQATFFMYPRAPETDDFHFASMLAREGVLVVPSTLFHHPGHFRISLTCNDDMLNRALPIFRRVLAGCCS